MPIFVTVPVDIPASLQLTPEMLSQNVSILAQEYVDGLAQQKKSRQTMSYAELANAIPLNVAFERLREKNRQYYAK